jgi:hypothetical protein
LSITSDWKLSIVVHDVDDFDDKEDVCLSLVAAHGVAGTAVAAVTVRRSLVPALPPTPF